MLLWYFRLPALLLLFLCSLTGNVVAQAPAPPPPTQAPAPQNLTVLVVDFQAIFQNSKAGKMLLSQAEQKGAEFRKIIAHQEDVLRADEQELSKQNASLLSEKEALQRQQGTLPAESFEQKKKQFEQRVNTFNQKRLEHEQKLKEYDQNGQAVKQAFEGGRSQALQKIEDEVNKIIQDIAKQRKANLVLQRQAVALYDQAFNVTDEVLLKLDEQMPTLIVNFTDPVLPSPSTAAPPSPPTSSGSTPKPKKK
jgi:Skp family chaperone for outer membrane proteins